MEESSHFTIWQFWLFPVYLFTAHERQKGPLQCELFWSAESLHQKVRFDYTSVWSEGLEPAGTTGSLKALTEASPTGVKGPVHALATPPLNGRGQPTPCRGDKDSQRGSGVHPSQPTYSPKPFTLGPLLPAAPDLCDCEWDTGT